MLKTAPSDLPLRRFSGAYGSWASNYRFSLTRLFLSCHIDDAVGPPSFVHMLRILTLSQSIAFRLCLPCLATLALTSFARAQSLDDVHVEPRQKANTEAASVEVSPNDAVSTSEVHTKPFRVDVDL